MYETVVNNEKMWMRNKNRGETYTAEKETETYLNGISDFGVLNFFSWLLLLGISKSHLLCSPHFFPYMLHLLINLLFPLEC